MESTLIALNPSVYQGIEIQVSIFKQGEKCYINSVNIIYQKKIIKKKRFYKVKKKYTQENVESIITSYFNQILEYPKKSKKKVNMEDKRRVASEIMNDFNN